MKQRIVFLSALAAVVSIAVFTAPWTTEGQNANRRTACSGLITKDDGQTVRMTALNTGSTPLQIKPTSFGYVVQNGPNAAISKTIVAETADFETIALQPGEGMMMDASLDADVVSGMFEWRESSNSSGLQINTQLINIATGEVLGIFGSDACKD